MKSNIRLRQAQVSFSPLMNKLFFWYALLMAFPAIQIFQNISVFIFIAIFFILGKAGYRNYAFSKKIQVFSLLFALGAIASTIGSAFLDERENLTRALTVLPNYLYWAFLIIFLVYHRNRLNLNDLFKGLTFGLLLVIPYYFFFQHSYFVSIIPFFARFSQNSFAFLLICFTPIAIYYIKSKYGKLAAIVFIVTFSAVGMLSGSRSSSILVFVGSFFAFFLTGKVNLARTAFAGITGILIIIVIQTNWGENMIKSLNPRTYDLIYNAETTFETDRSYLVRRALVEKGIDLFKRYPMTGVGLNSFGATTGNIAGNFEGSAFVINKGIEQGKSAHNSYISLLAEGGLALIIPFALILFTLLIHFIRKFRSMPDFYRPVFIGVLMMAIHLYFISAILNVFGWFLLGLAAALVYRDKEKNIAHQQVLIEKKILSIEQT